MFRTLKASVDEAYLEPHVVHDLRMPPLPPDCPLSALSFGERKKRQAEALVKAQQWAKKIRGACVATPKSTFCEM